MAVAIAIVRSLRCEFKVTIINLRLPGSVRPVIQTNALQRRFQPVNKAVLRDFGTNGSRFAD